MALAKKPFVVIDADILSSSIWSETLETRIVWFTLLILCDTDGYVGAALPGIASAAGVTLPQCEAAMQRLMSPDSYSRTQADEGRRIRVAERGWQILNFRDHLNRLSSERAKSRERMKRHREKQRALRHSDATVTTGNREKGKGNREHTSTEPPATAVALVPSSDWNREAADDFIAVYGAPPPKQFFAQVKPVAKQYGWQRTREALRAYMAETPIEYLNIAKCLAVKVEAGARAPTLSPKAKRQLDGFNALLRGGLKGDGTC